MAVLPTVVLVDDSPDVRLLVRAYVEFSGRLQVVAEGATGVEAIALAGDHHPDLMLLDISMPEMDGLEALPQIRAISPETRVIMFTGFEEQGLGERARQLGAVGLREKSMSARDLVDDLVQMSAVELPASVRAVSSDRAQDLPLITSAVLEEHRERFREVFDEAAIGMGTMTLAGHLVRANKAFAAIVGESSENLVGTSYQDLIPEADREAFAAVLRTATTTDVPVVESEHGLLCMPATGRVHTSLAPIRDSHGVALYVFVQLQDVSEQRAAEAALRLSEERFRLLVETVTDYAIFMLDPEGRVQSWNAGAQRMKGYAADEIIGEHFRRFYPAEMQRIRHPEHELQLALRDGHYEEEGWRVRKDGTLMWANIVLTAIHDPSGAHLGFAKITRDVTERRRMLDQRDVAAAASARMNEDLEAANVRLARAAEDQAHFLAATAHELRTPIAVLGGTAEILRDEKQLKDADRDRLLESMVANAARLRRLVEDLLAAARLDAQVMVMDQQPLRLAPVLEDAVAAVNRRSSGDIVHLEHLDGEIVVLADTERLGQIVDNLLSNAVHHGRPPVEVTAVLTGDTVELRVADSGDGVSPAIRERLFDRYATASPNGTGLGLFIVRELARAHGGDAWYEGEHPPTFVVSLPVARPEEHPDRQTARGGS